MSNTLKTALTSIVLGLAVLFIIASVSEFLFGDLTNVDSYKPLLILVPVMVSVLYFLIKKTS